MNDIARGYRESMLGLLELIADPSEQRAFAKKVPYDDYASELYCLWFDDEPRKDSELAQQAFLPDELEILSSFSYAWSGADEVLGQTNRSIETLLANGSWRSIIEAAANAIASLKRITT